MNLDFMSRMLGNLYSLTQVDKEGQDNKFLNLNEEIYCPGPPDQLGLSYTNHQAYYS